MNTYIAIYANTNTNTNNSKMSLEDLHAVGHGLVVPLLLSLSTPALRFHLPAIYYQTNLSTAVFIYSNLNI